jgi:hypothetical protein
MSILPAARRAASVVVAAAAVWVAGCGPAVGTVSGTVTQNGRPVPDVTLSFVSPDGTVNTAQVGTDGTYTVANVPVGPVQVTVQSTRAVGESEQEVIKKGKSGVAPKAASKVGLDPKFGDPQTSGLSLTVKAGDNKYDVDLK